MITGSHMNHFLACSHGGICERARKIRSYKRPGCHLDDLSILRYNPEVVELKHD